MAISFPATPTLGQTYSVGTKTWTWNGYAWDIVTANLVPTYTTTNAAFGVANASYTSVNAAYTVANAAFGVANNTANLDYDIQRSGFVNQTQTYLAFDASNNIFTLADSGSGWSYYINGTKYTVSGNVSVHLSGANNAPNGVYFISIANATNGMLTSSTSQWSLLDSTTLPVASVKWNKNLTPTYLLADERHAALIDTRMHFYLHTTRGTQVEQYGTLSGYTVGGSYDANNCFSISQTILEDEDIILTIPALASSNGVSNTYLISYRTSANTWVWQPSNVPFIYNSSSGYIQYDNGGTMTDVGNNKYVNSYLLFSNYISGTTGLTGAFAFFPGRSTFGSLAAAQAEDPTTFDLTGYGWIEHVWAYQLTWLCKNTFGQTGNVQLAAEPRKIAVPTTISSTSSIPAHNQLAGLQGGDSANSYYYHLTQSEYGTLQANIGVAAFGVANAAFGIANAAANNLANTAIAANNYAGFMANSVNTYTSATYATITTVATNATSANNWSNTYANQVGTNSNTYAGVMANSVNAYTTATYATITTVATNATSANNYAGAMANSANTYAGTVGVNANTYASSVGVNANNWSNTYANQVGTNANTYTNSANVFLYGLANAIGILANTAGTVANNANVWANSTFVKLSLPGQTQTITGDIAITGNLTFTGNTTFIDSNTLVIGDTLIYLGANNYSGTDLLDIGWICNYGNTTHANVHTGLYRDHVSKEYFLFQGYDIEPGSNNVITPYSNNMVNAVLNADLITSNLTLGGANANVWIAGIVTNAAASFGLTNLTYTAVNSAFGVINAAFDSANTVGGYINTVGGYANTVGGYANQAGVIANAAFGLTNTTYAAVNSAFGVINAAFGSANTVGGYANTAGLSANQAGVIANAAFGAANSLGTSVNNKVDAITSNSTARLWANSVTVGAIETVYLDLATSGVTATTYGGTTNIPVVTVDAYGRVTSASNVAFSGGGGASVSVSNTAPSSPTANSMWWNTTYGRLLIYYQDADSSQWVDASPSYNPQPIFDVANAAFAAANSSPSYRNSTTFSAPTGDLNGSDTYVGQTLSTDAFGVSLVSVYDFMDPTGSLQTIDLGSAVAI